MNLRILLLLALVVAGVAVWFYQQQDSVMPSINIKNSELEYEATNIQAVQTNEQGQTEYQLDAKSLSFNPKTNQDEMSEVTMTWQPVANQHYRIEAGIAAINQQTGDMRLTNGFVFMSNANEALGDGMSDAINSTDASSKDSTDATPAVSAEQTSNAEGIIIRGQTLKGNTKQQMLYSDEPVIIEQGDNQFQAARMQVNLQTGEYEFAQVAASYTPAPRQDKALF